MESIQTTDRPTEPIMSIQDWIITFIVLIIPLVNIIMLFVWAFGSGTSKTKSNFAKAQLIMMIIFIVLGILFSILVASLGVFAGGFPMEF